MHRNAAASIASLLAVTGQGASMTGLEKQLFLVQKKNASESAESKATKITQILQAQKGRRQNLNKIFTYMCHAASPEVVRAFFPFLKSMDVNEQKDALYALANRANSSLVLGCVGAVSTIDVNVRTEQTIKCDGPGAATEMSLMLRPSDLAFINWCSEKDQHKSDGSKAIVEFLLTKGAEPIQDLIFFKYGTVEQWSHYLYVANSVLSRANDGRLNRLFDSLLSGEGRTVIQRSIVQSAGRTELFFVKQLLSAIGDISKFCGNDLTVAPAQRIDRDMKHAALLMKDISGVLARPRGAGAAVSKMAAAFKKDRRMDMILAQLESFSMHQQAAMPDVPVSTKFSGKKKKKAKVKSSAPAKTPKQAKAVGAKKRVLTASQKKRIRKIKAKERMLRDQISRLSDKKGLAAVHQNIKEYDELVAKLKEERPDLTRIGEGQAGIKEEYELKKRAVESQKPADAVEQQQDVERADDASGPAPREIKGKQVQEVPVDTGTAAAKQAKGTKRQQRQRRRRKKKDRRLKGKVSLGAQGKGAVGQQAREKAVVTRTAAARTSAKVERGGASQRKAQVQKLRQQSKSAGAPAADVLKQLKQQADSGETAAERSVEMSRQLKEMLDIKGSYASAAARGHGSEKSEPKQRLPQQTPSEVPGNGTAQVQTADEAASAHIETVRQVVHHPGESAPATEQQAATDWVAYPQQFAMPPQPAMYPGMPPLMYPPYPPQHVAGGFGHFVPAPMQGFLPGTQQQPLYTGVDHEAELDRQIRILEKQQRLRELQKQEREAQLDAAQ